MGSTSTYRWAHTLKFFNQVSDQILLNYVILIVIVVIDVIVIVNRSDMLPIQSLSHQLDVSAAASVCRAVALMRPFEHQSCRVFVVRTRSSGGPWVAPGIGIRSHSERSVKELSENTRRDIRWRRAYRNLPTKSTSVVLIGSIIRVNDLRGLALELLFICSRVELEITWEVSKITHPY